MNTFFKIVPRIAKLFSGSNPFVFLFNLSQLWLLLICNEILHFNLNFTLVCTYENKKFNLNLKDKSDIGALKDTFVEQEYNWSEIQNPKIVVDLGAHVGDTALYYHCMYPEAIIYAVEADPNIYQRLVKNVSFTNSIIPVHAAIGGTDGSVTLNVSPRSSLSGSIMDRKSNTDSFVVPAFTIETLYKKFGIGKADLFKFDIEGAELHLFDRHPAGHYASAYIGELHCDIMGNDMDSFISKNFPGFSIESMPLGKKGRYNLKAQIVPDTDNL